jgi:hypothetical protein
MPPPWVLKSPGACGDLLKLVQIAVSASLLPTHRCRCYPPAPPPVRSGQINGMAIEWSNRVCGSQFRCAVVGG